MKSTKNILMAGVVVAIALFASVQVTAMEMGRKVNPHLTREQEEFVRDKIEFKTELIKNAWYCDPKKRNLGPCEFEKKKLSALKTIYYGNKPYTNDQIADVYYNVFTNKEYDL
jgi:hypothetical protein